MGRGGPKKLGTNALQPVPVRRFNFPKWEADDTKGKCSAIHLGAVHKICISSGVRGTESTAIHVGGVLQYALRNP